MLNFYEFFFYLCEARSKTPSLIHSEMRSNLQGLQSFMAFEIARS